MSRGERALYAARWATLWGLLGIVAAMALPYFLPIEHLGQGQLLMIWAMVTIPEFLTYYVLSGENVTG